MVSKKSPRYGKHSVNVWVNDEAEKKLKEYIRATGLSKTKAVERFVIGYVTAWDKRANKDAL